jgi:hypothetical protein
MGWFGKANGLDVITSLIERGAAWWFAVSTIVGSGAVTGVAAYYSNLQPIHIAASVAAVALTIAVVFLLIGLARVRYARASVMQKVANDTDVINPLSETFEKKRIRMSDFYTPYQYVYRNRSFIDCEIIGPGVVLLSGNIDIKGIANCDFVEVPDQFSAGNVTVFTAVTFRRCSFYNMTIIAPTTLAAKIKALKNVKTNWITDKAPDPVPGKPHIKVAG